LGKSTHRPSFRASKSTVIPAKAGISLKDRIDV
jgi:hypothetical protein